MASSPSLSNDFIDSAAFAPWLSTHAPMLGDGSLTISRLTGGSSNTMALISRGDQRAVLRMPARPPRADSLKALEREARLLKALAGSNVPHPELIAYCSNADLLGAPFILMSFVDGWMNFDDAPAPAPFDRPGEPRRGLAFAMIDALATLRGLDYVAAGLSDFGKPEGFLTRQVPRYLKLIESYKESENHPGRDIPGMAYVTDWLQDNTPPMSAITLIHGDLGFPNILFERTPPPRVAAMIDWEVATIGDPLLDLGRTIFSFPGRRVGDGKSRFGDLSDYPTREDLAERYADRTGADISTIDYYCVLSMFKLAALIEWNYARAVNGRDSNGMAQKIADHVVDMIGVAERMARAA
ncbi:MAG: phosphotransferase family protein [Hyphomonadaceae bacterium]